MIARRKYFPEIFLIFFIVVQRTRCSYRDCERDVEIDETIEDLDAMLADLKMERYSRETNDRMKIWQEYEFDTGAGNREELIVTNISIEAKETFPSGIKNWQYTTRSSRGGILAGSGDDNLWIRFLDNQDGGAQSSFVLTASDKILTFKVISLVNSSVNFEEIIAVLGLESGSETKLAWYKFASDKFELISSLIVPKRVERLEFFQDNGQPKIVILNEPIEYVGSVYSSIDVYGFNLVGDLLDLWLCQKIWVPKVTRFEICPVYEDTILAIQSGNSMVFYQYEQSQTDEGMFKLLQNITSNGLKSMTCFKSGYAEYLMATGPEPAMFTFRENEFLYDSEMEKLFNNVGEILWAECLPVKTYREDCLLLIQLKNLTVLGSTWQGENFKLIDLPEIPLKDFQLSEIIPIPGYGFALEGKLVRVETKLRDLPRPVYDEMEKILQLKNSLQEIFSKQETLFDETVRRIESSFYTNPVITGLWHVSEINTHRLIISDLISSESVHLGSKSCSLREFVSNLDPFEDQLTTLDKKIRQIDSLRDVTVREGSPIVELSRDSVFDGQFEVRGTLHVKNLTLNSLNGISTEKIMQDLVRVDRDRLIEGRKYFPSIDADTVNVAKLNGVPIENIIFDDERRNYENVDFGKIDRLVVEGNLNFESINGYDWDKLMKSLVWKNRPAVIPGTTIVDGDIIANSVSTSLLNGFKYPNDYVLQNDNGYSDITGTKSFDNLKVQRFNGVKTINGEPYENFVTLNEPRVLSEEITFKNLVIEESLEIEGKLTGINTDQKRHRLTLQDIHSVTGDTIFANLRVHGNVIVEDSLNGKTAHDFDDIIRKSDEYAVIRGEKRFLGSVKIEEKLRVASKKYNGHAFDDFATLSGSQKFPNLRKISAPVSFGELKYKQSNDLENYLKKFTNNRSEGCSSEKRIIFNVPPLLKDLEFYTLNKNIKSDEFSRKYNETFKNLEFDELSVENLRVARFDATRINEVNFADFQARRVSLSKPQNLTGNVTIERLETDVIRAESINDLSTNDLEKIRADFEELSSRIWSGKMTMDEVVIDGRLGVKSINGLPLSEIYARKGVSNVVTDGHFYAKNLQVRGLVNGINLTEYFSDAVLRTDEDVVFTGRKTFDSLTSDTLEFPWLNGVAVANILNPRVEQSLSGPVFVKGHVIVEKEFDSGGKINDVDYERLAARISYRGNDTLELQGHFRFVEETRIENLSVDGNIQGTTFDSFLDTAIFPDDDVDVSGTKSFRGNVQFRDNLTIFDGYNGIDLGSFNDKAVLVDEDVHVGSELIFEDDVTLEGNLIVEKELSAKRIADVDIDELETSAVFVNGPSYISGSLTFTNARFASRVTVDYLNNIDLRNVIPLREEQVILNSLSCENASVETLDVTGTLNDRDPREFFANTFTLSGDQIVTGNLTIHGNVRVAGDMDAIRLNGMRTSRLISLDDDEKLNGSFRFENGLTLRKDLRVTGLINGLDVLAWETEAVYDNFPQKQTIRGDWYVDGNVRFEKDVLGDGSLNGLDVQKLSDKLKIRKWELDARAVNEKTDSKTICEDLRNLQIYANNQIYKFKYFEYLQIFTFDVRVSSMHSIESEESNYLLMNLDPCFLNVASYNGTDYEIVTSKTDFDEVQKWITLDHDHRVYIVTVGSGNCGRNPGNLWKFEKQTLIHVLDLGNVTDAKRTNDGDFLIVSDGRLEKWSIEGTLGRSYGNETSYFSTSHEARFVPNTRRILLADDQFVYEFDPVDFKAKKWINYFGKGTIIAIRSGIFETETFLYYDEALSENNAFIFNGLADRRIRQSVPTHKAKSFLPVNFDGRVETLLTFVQNDRSLEIFEYKGVEGFAYRESIKMQIDQTYGFGLRKHSGLARTNCIGIRYGNTLAILEARMYGEKLDMEDLDCDN